MHRLTAYNTWFGMNMNWSKFTFKVYENHLKNQKLSSLPAFVEKVIQIGVKTYQCLPFADWKSRKATHIGLKFLNLSVVINNFPQMWNILFYCDCHNYYNAKSMRICMFVLKVIHSTHDQKFNHFINKKDNKMANVIVQLKKKTHTRLLHMQHKK